MKRIILLFVLMAVPCFAVRTFYIDFVGGSDSNSVAQAQSNATPWKRAPGMSGNTISGYSHIAGDRFIFKGGVTWDNTCFMFTIPGSGNSTDSDYFGVDVTWYTGGAWSKPVFDGEYIKDKLVSVGSNTYFTFDRIEMKRVLCDTNFGDGLIVGVAPNHVTFTGLYLHGWRSSASTDDASGGIILVYPTLSAVPDVTMDGCEVENSENANNLTTGNSTTSFTIGTGSKAFTYTGGLTVAVGQYVRIRSVANAANNMGGRVTAVGGGVVTVNVTSTTGSGTTANWTLTGPYTQNGLAVRQVAIIKNGSRIHDVSSAVLFTSDFGGVRSSNNLPSYLYNVTGDSFDIIAAGAGYHPNGIYLDAQTMGGSGAVGYIRNSYLHDISGAANMCYPNTRNSTIYIYNNVMWAHTAAQLMIDCDTYNYGTGNGGNLVVYNNTMVLALSNSYAMRVVAGASNPRPPLLSLAAYNNHIIGTNAGLLQSSANITTYTNGNTVNQTPATATSQGYVLANFYAPVSTSGSTYNAGTSQSGTFTNDINNISRPQATIWDVGAYEFSEPGMTLTTVGSSGTALAVDFSESVSIGAGGNGGMKLTVDGVDFTGTYSSGAPGTTLNYTVGKIYQDAVVTTTYTQPGNGIESTGTGVDVTTYTARPVTNSSTQVIPPPTSPTSTAISTTAIDVGWTPPAGNFTFIIYRSLTDGNFVQIGTAADGETTYHDTGLSQGTKYYYVISSVAQGLTSAQTASTNATTFGLSGYTSQIKGNVKMSGNAKVR